MATSVVELVSTEDCANSAVTSAAGAVVHDTAPIAPEGPRRCTAATVRFDVTSEAFRAVAKRLRRAVKRADRLAARIARAEHQPPLRRRS